MVRQIKVTLQGSNPNKGVSKVLPVEEVEGRTLGELVGMMTSEQARGERQIVLNAVRQEMGGSAGYAIQLAAPQPGVPTQLVRGYNGDKVAPYLPVQAPELLLRVVAVGRLGYSS